MKLGVWIMGLWLVGIGHVAALELNGSESLRYRLYWGPLAVGDARLDYRYPPGAVRRLDDTLLAAYGETYVELPGNAHRVALLRTRLERMRA